MYQITCRTCLSLVADDDECIQITELLDSETIKDVLLHHVPQMEQTVSDKDRICFMCFDTLKKFNELINRCMEIEEQLNSNQIVFENLDSEDDKFYDRYSCDTSIVSANIIDLEHDYVKNHIKYEPQHGEFISDDIQKKEEVDEEDINTLELISVSPSTSQALEHTLDSHEENQSPTNIAFLNSSDEVLSPVDLSIEESTNDSSMDMEENEDDAKLDGTGNNNMIGQSMDEDEMTLYETLDESLETNENQIFYSTTNGKLIFYESIKKTSEGCYVCEACGDSFPNQQILSEHFLHHAELRFMCDQCPRIFKTDSALKAHFRLKHTAYERFKCNTCGMLFARGDYLKNHEKHHGDWAPDKYTLKCKTPGKFLRFKQTDDPVPCKICGKYYNGIQKLKVHLQTHLVVKRFKCGYCDLTYKRWPSVKRHEKTHLESNAAFHRCNVCWKRFNTKEKLDNHSTQHGNPKYRCQVCNEQFHRKYLFDDHYLMKHATSEDIENSKKEVIYDTLLELSTHSELVEISN